jgi:hypothetical protein
MEKYNKVYLVLWLLFSAVTLSFMLVFVLNALAEMLDEATVTLSFFLLFLTSEIIGFAIASLAIDRISWLTTCSLVNRLHLFPNLVRIRVLRREA